MEQYTLITYITNNYITLLLLASLLLLLIVNRKMKIEGLHYMWIIIGIVFVLTICEAVEDMCDLYGWNVRILYFKTAAVYWLYPLTAMLELYLVAPIKHKFLFAAPYAVNFILVFIDLFDTRIIYYFEDNHSFGTGVLRILPIAVLVFYVAVLGIYSASFPSKGARSKGAIALFMTVSSVLAAIGEVSGFARGYTETVTALEILIYYFFLAAINFGETQKNLYESRIELEQDRIKLLVAQMQPHFIFNSLATIQSLCYTDSDAAADCIDVFGDYLRANINSLSSDKPIWFENELEHIKQYIMLEKASTNVDFEVIYELGVTSFKVPPLTVQPIAENAIKHGALTRRDGSGRVIIKTVESEGNIVITVTDNGIGAVLTDKQKEHRSVGIENAKKRLAVQCGGTFDISFSDEGCTAVITIPRDKGDSL